MLIFLAYISKYSAKGEYLRFRAKFLECQDACFEVIKLPIVCISKHYSSIIKYNSRTKYFPSERRLYTQTQAYIMYFNINVHNNPYNSDLGVFQSSCRLTLYFSLIKNSYLDPFSDQKI